MTKELVTCNRCGWVHMGVSMEYALEEVRLFNQYFDSLDPDKQKEYYGGKGAEIDTYLRCSTCGNNYKHFRKSKEGDCPNGCTIGPVLHFEEKQV